MRRTILPFSLGIVFASLGAPLPHAQTVETPAPPTAPAEDCQVSPLDEAAPPSAGDTLSGTLAPCNGVLTPPAVGDQEMSVDPPALGETPIIPPEMVPPQPARKD